MPDNTSTEERIIALESLLTRQERLIDDLNAEILRLNTLFERLEHRLDNYETRQENALMLRPLSEEPPPPHY